MARVLPVDEHRTGHADRDLGHAREVLHVALHDRRVERVGADVLERGAGLLGQEDAPRLGRVGV